MISRRSLLRAAPALILAPAIVGCALMGDVSASDPTERGLSYVASAIVLAAIIRMFR